MSERNGTPPVSRRKDGREWRIGSQADVAWIQDSAPAGLAVTSATPPVFEAYAAIVVPDEEGRAEDVAVVLGLLTGQSPGRAGYAAR